MEKKNKSYVDGLYFDGYWVHTWVTNFVINLLCHLILVHTSENPLSFSFAFCDNNKCKTTTITIIIMIFFKDVCLCMCVCTSMHVMCNIFGILLIQHIVSFWNYLITRVSVNIIND